jgi:hypothetical protein
LTSEASPDYNGGADPSWRYNFRSIFNDRTRLEYAREWEAHIDRGRWFDGNDFVGIVYHK